MTHREPQNDDFMTVDANRRRLHLREVAGSAAGRYDGIGGELRAARMRNRLDLEAIGVKLRINAAYLLAIEEGRFSDLPGHVYVYGFLRTYAQHLGLDAEAVIQQYKTEAANPKPTAKLDFPSPMDRGRLPTLRILLLSILLAGLVYGGWSMLTEENRQTAERVAPLPDRFANLAGSSSTAPAPAATATAAAPATSTSVPPAAVAPAEPAPAPAEPVAAAAAEPPPAPAPLPALVAVTPANPPPPAPAAASPAPAAIVPALAPANPPPIPTPAPAAAQPVPPAPQPIPPVVPAPVAAAPAPPAAAPPAATSVTATPSTPALAGDDPRRRAGEGSPSVNSTAAPAAVAPLPGQEGVARRLSTVTERPGVSAVVPATPAPAPSPAPTPSAAAPAIAATPADEPATDEEEEADAPPPPPTPRAATGPDAVRNPNEITITSLPPPAAPGPSAPAAAAPPVPAVPAPATQSFGATGEPSRITVRADIDSWVQVTTTAGQPVFARMLRAGDQYLVPNRPGLRLMTGNGGGLRITVDGSPTPPIGTLGSVVRDVALEPERLLRGNATANETPGG